MDVVDGLRPSINRLFDKILARFDGIGNKQDNICFANEPISIDPRNEGMVLDDQVDEVHTTMIDPTKDIANEDEVAVDPSVYTPNTQSIQWSSKIKLMLKIHKIILLFLINWIGHQCNY